MLGVIACPITSGDTAFRSARLVVADWFKIDQKAYASRLKLCIPLLAAGAIIGHLDYTIVWRYFSWTNQTLAMIVLWTASMYLYQREKRTNWAYRCACNLYERRIHDVFLLCRRMLNLGTTVAYPAGIILAVVFLGIFMRATKKQQTA